MAYSEYRGGRHRLAFGDLGERQKSEHNEFLIMFMRQKYFTTRLFLKAFAWLCKLTAIVFWLCVARVKVGLDITNLRATSPPMYRDAPEDWGTPAFYHRTYLEIATLLALAVLSVLPNRWLVFSPMAFSISLLIALIPFYSIITSIAAPSDLLWMTPLMSLFAMLPASLVLSFWRHRKGEKVNYV